MEEWAHRFDMATHQFGGWGYGKLKRRLTGAVSYFLQKFPLALSVIKLIFPPA
jgi:hypothetical protein